MRLRPRVSNCTATPLWTSNCYPIFLGGEYVSQFIPLQVAIQGVVALPIVSSSKELVFLIPATYPIICGLDVHRGAISAALLDTRGQTEPILYTQEFSALTYGLYDLRQWLIDHGCPLVAMESTGIYWKAPYNVLAEASITSHILNPFHVRAIPGKKTDQTDAQRIAYLSMHNLVRPSYIPEPVIMNLRLLTRQRWAVVNSLRRTKNSITRTLDECNIKFSLVATDLFGVSGRLVLKTLLEEQTPDPLSMANLAKGKLRKKIPQLYEALRGHLSEEHRFILEFLLNDLKHIEEDLATLDAKINAYVSEHKLQPWLDILLSVPGIKRLSAINILAEIGTDLSSFPDSAHFASWIALCPGNNTSAGKSKSSDVRKANRYLRAALVQVAWAAARQKNSPLAKYFYAVKRRRGANKALIALAHKLVRIIYALFTRQEKFDFAKLVSSPVSVQPALSTEVPEADLPEVSELAEKLACIVEMAAEDDLPEPSIKETGLSSSAPVAIPNAPVQSVVTNNPEMEETNIATVPKKRCSTKTADKQERPTTTEPVTRRRGRPRKQQTVG